MYLQLRLDNFSFILTIQFLKEQYFIKKRKAILKGWLNKKHPFWMMGKKNVIFLHIPKTAGTSIRESLIFYPAFSDILQYDQHHTTKQILYLIGEKKWQQSFTFCFVRNPWDRFFSQHQYFLRKKIIQKKEINFDYWAKKMIEETYKNDPQKKQNIHFYPASDWMKNRDGKIMNFDFIGKFENIKNDFNNLCQILNWQTPLKKMNTAPQFIDYKTVYSPSLIDETTQFFQEDIEKWNYSFE